MSRNVSTPAISSGAGNGNGNGSRTGGGGGGTAHARAASRPATADASHATSSSSSATLAGGERGERGGRAFPLTRQLSGSASANGMGGVVGRMFRRQSQSGTNGVGASGGGNGNASGSGLPRDSHSSGNLVAGSSSAGAGAGAGTGTANYSSPSLSSNHIFPATPADRSTSFDNMTRSASNSHSNANPSSSNPAGNSSTNANGGGGGGRPSFLRSASNQIAQRVRKLSQSGSVGISTSHSHSGGGSNIGGPSSSSTTSLLAAPQAPSSSAAAASAAAGGTGGGGGEESAGVRRMAAAGLRSSSMGTGLSASGAAAGRRSMDVYAELEDSSAAAQGQGGSVAAYTPQQSAQNNPSSSGAHTSIPSASTTTTNPTNPSTGTSTSVGGGGSTPHRIRLVPHLEATRSLHFEPIERDVKESHSPIKIGRFTDRNPPANANANAGAPALPSVIVAGGQGGGTGGGGGSVNAGAAGGTLHAGGNHTMDTSDDHPSAGGAAAAGASTAAAAEDGQSAGGAGAFSAASEMGMSTSSTSASVIARAPGMPGARGGAIPSSAGGGGRVDTARVAFKSKVVSRSHAEIWCEGGGNFFLRDTKSSSGTFLNHIRLSGPNLESKPFPIKDGDVIQLGVDYQGGTEEIYRCVKMRVELNRGWQRSATQYNVNALRQLRALQGTPLPAAAVAGAVSSQGPADGASNAEATSALPTNAQSVSVTDCCICLFSVTVCQSLFIAPCSHVFHYKCIRPLLLRHHPGFSCPLCRTFADLEADVEEDEAWQKALLVEAMAGTHPHSVRTPLVESEQPTMTIPESAAEMLAIGEDGGEMRPSLTVTTNLNEDIAPEEQQEVLASAGAVDPNMQDDEEMEDGTRSFGAPSAAREQSGSRPIEIGRRNADAPAVSGEESRTPLNQHFLSTLAESGSISRAGSNQANALFHRSPLAHEITADSRRESQVSHESAASRPDAFATPDVGRSPAASPAPDHLGVDPTQHDGNRSSGSGPSPPRTANEDFETNMAAESSSRANRAANEETGARTPKGKSPAPTGDGNHYFGPVDSVDSTTSGGRPRSLSGHRSRTSRSSQDPDAVGTASPSKIGRLWRKASGAVGSPGGRE